MASVPSVPCQAYRICGYTQSNAGEKPAWVTFHVRLHGRSFHIHVSEARFGNSPGRLQEFWEYLGYLASGDDGCEGENNACESDDGDSAAQTCEDQSDGEEMSIDDCFGWAARPFLRSFERMAPKPLTATVTLEDYFSAEEYECHLGAVEDVLQPGSITLLDETPPFILRDCPDDEIMTQKPPPSSIFPTFPLSQIEILSDDQDHILDDEPRLVRVQNAEYFFKSFEGAGEESGRKEIQTYEQIATANFGPDVRTSTLFGIAQDDGRIMGMLLHRIHEDTTLAEAVLPTTTEDTRTRWKEQTRKTLLALHQAGIVWGDAKASNVLVDGHGEAWIVGFGGGHSEGVRGDGGGGLGGSGEDCRVS